MGPWGTNAYIIVSLPDKNSLLVDAPADADRIMKSLEGTKPQYILITHCHSDHTGALTQLRSRLKVPTGTHPADAKGLPHPPDMLLNDGDRVSLGGVKIEVLHTPGHTDGSLCFKAGKYLIAGDTLFPGGPGKTVSPDNFRQIVKSITGKILMLPDDTLVYPGHGDSTVLKKEKDEFAIFSSRSHPPDLYGDVLWLSS